MRNVEDVMDSADLIIGEYAFEKVDDGVTVVNLNHLNKASFIFNDEVVETSMDDIEAYMVGQIYLKNKKYL